MFWAWLIVERFGLRFGFPCQFFFLLSYIFVIVFCSSMFHCWFSNTDGNSYSIRVCLLDFSKAFDRINHKILIDKMRLLDIYKSLINWVIYFRIGNGLETKSENRICLI